MNIQSTDTPDETFEMRLLTDAELNDVNGGVLAVFLLAAALGSLAAILTHPSGFTDGPVGEVYWPAA